MTVKTMLKDEILNELIEVSKLEVGSDKHKAAVDSVSRLADKMIELEKIDIDSRDKAEIRENDYELRIRQINDEKKDRFVKNCLTGVTIVTGVGVAIWGTLVSMRFEKEDSFSSTLGRKWIDKTISFIKR